MARRSSRERWRHDDVTFVTDSRQLVVVVDVVVVVPMLSFIVRCLSLSVSRALFQSTLSDSRGFAHEREFAEVGWAWPCGKGGRGGTWHVHVSAAMSGTSARRDVITWLTAGRPEALISRWPCVSLVDGRSMGLWRDDGDCDGDVARRLCQLISRRPLVVLVLVVHILLLTRRFAAGVVFSSADWASIYNWPKAVC